MARPDFSIKRNDTLPLMRVSLVNPDGTPFTDLVGATITLFYQATDLDEKTDPKQTGLGSFTVVGGATPTGDVDYSWAAADTDTVDSYRFEVEVLPAAGGRSTFPGGSYGLFDVTQDLGDA